MCGYRGIFIVPEPAVIQERRGTSEATSFTFLGDRAGETFQ